MESECRPISCSPDTYGLVYGQGVAKEGEGSSMGAGILRDIVHEYMEEHPGTVSPFVTRRVRELLFDGYADGLLAELSIFKREKILPNNTFGLYYGVRRWGICLGSQHDLYLPSFQKNGSLGSTYEVRGGVDDYREFGRILRVDGAESLGHWEEAECNRINGTDGSLVPPFVTKDRLVRVFSEDTCRSIYMTFQKEVAYFGVPALRFHLAPELWETPALNPDNTCFATRTKNRAGLMDMSPCKKGRAGSFVLHDS
jgi:hypothetical protein